MADENFIKALTDIDPEEVSLVYRGANRKRVAFSKEEGGHMPRKIENLIKTVLETESAGDSKVEAFAKEAKLSDKATDALVAARRAVDAYRDELPASTHVQIAKALDLECIKTVEKIVEKIVEKSAPKDPVVELPAAQREAFEKMQKESADNAKQLAEMKRENRKREFFSKSEKEFSHVGGSHADKAEVLMRVSDLDPALGATLETIFKSDEKVIASNDRITQAIGRTGGGANDDSPMGKLNKLAEAIRGADPKLSIQQAFAKAAKDNPQLAKQHYNGEES